MAVNQIRGGAALSYVSLLLGNLIVILYTPFMLRMLGQSEYGIYSICNTVSSTIAMMDAGLAVAAVKFFSQERNSPELPSIVGTFFLFYLALGIISFVVSILIASGASEIFAKSMTLSEIHSVRIILIITGVYLFFTFLTSVFNAYVVANERFVFIKFLDIIRSLPLPMLIIPFLLKGHKAIAMSTITVCVFLLINIIKSLYSIKKLRIRVSFKGINPKFIKEALPFALIVLTKLLLERLYWTSGQFILGIVSGTVAVAIYSLAIQMRGYYEAVSATLNNLFLPRFSKLSTEENSIYASSVLFLRICRVQTLIMGIVICGFFIFGKPFLILWAGSEYEPSFYCSLLIMIPCTIPFIQGSANAILQAQGKVNYQMAVYLFASLFVIFGAFIVGGHWGAEGLSVVSLIAVTLFEIIIMNLYYARIGIDMKRFWSDFVHVMSPYVILTVVFYVAFRFVNINSWLGLALGVVIFTACSCVVSFLFSMNTEERSLVANLIGRIVGLKR